MSSDMVDITDLPLRIATPISWAALALEDPLALLNDHAHLERKAANNALELLLRWPEPNPPENWVKAMTAIAKDEIESASSCNAFPPGLWLMLPFVFFFLRRRRQ